VGNLLALLQTNIKRVLAYSSIAHLGYLLVAFLAGGSLAITAVAFYLVAYFVSTLAALGSLALLSGPERDADSIDDYRGLLWRRPGPAIVLIASLFSLAGIPLTAGFVGKLYLLASGAGSGLWLLVIVLVGSSVIGLFYYLRIIVAMYQQPSADGSRAIVPAFPLAGGLVLALLSLALVWLGVYPAPFLQAIGTVLAAWG
jgi:NADH-quinone oxidoreductase subunit N